MSNSKIVIKSSISKTNKPVCKKVHPALIDVAQQVTLNDRWKNDYLDYQANKTVSSIEHKQVSLNARWLDDCVG